MLTRFKIVHRRAFSLVELLVVIGIIAVLLAILVPSLAKARATAKQVACMSNLRQIGIAIQMYAGDNRDHFPMQATTGGVFSYRRRPGLRDPLDAGSYPEWKGLPAILHGIRGDEFNLGMSILDVKTALNQRLASPPRYLSATSNVWLCPAASDYFRPYGNTYAWTILRDSSGTNPIADPGTWTSNLRAKNRTTLYMWENINFMPYVPGADAPPSVQGYTTPSGVQIFPHPGRKGTTKGSYNELLMDLSVVTLRV